MSGARACVRGLLGAVAPPIVELCRAPVAMAGGLLHVFELRAVLQPRGDEWGSVRTIWVAAADMGGSDVLSDKLDYHVDGAGQERSRPGGQNRVR
jgi:hypothetical protein